MGDDEPGHERRKPSAAYCRDAWEAVCASQAVAEFSFDGMITWTNSEFSSLVGHPNGGLIGQPHRVLCDPAIQTSDEYRKFWEKLRAGETQQGVFPRIRRDGSPIWIHAVYKPIYRTNRSHRILKIANDVTHERQLELQALAHERELEQTIGQVQDIVDTISSIAGQTKLLSINASIEAARAGEFGRGFAIVASEVKKLAAETQAATDTATKMVQSRSGRLQRASTIDPDGMDTTAAASDYDPEPKQISR